MLTRLRNIWRPQNFHLNHELGRRRGYFEGWYFKLVDAAGAQPYAIIPGVFLGPDSHSFIQVLDGRAGTAVYHRFPVEAFHAERDAFQVTIADNRFGPDELALNIDANATEAGQTVQGKLSLGRWSSWPVTLTSPGVMGPYSFVPFMECKHGILSLDHELQGQLQVDGVQTSFDGGRGYLEKDWGRAFPRGYVWTHSNHFDRPGICVTVSIARIPWLTRAFRGFLVGFLIDGELHRFTTYNGAEIESLTMTDTHLHLRIRNRTHRLEVNSRKRDGALLHAPYGKQMIERVAETMTSDIELRFTSLASGALLYEGHGRNACLEAQGDLASVIDA